MLDKSFKGDLESQIHTVDAASNTTNQLNSYKPFRRVFMHYSRILFQCNRDYKRLYIECQKGPYLAFALHFFIYLSHALFIQRTTLSISSRSYNYCAIRTNRAFHISIIVEENMLNAMEIFFSTLFFLA